jgi:hypothetical protein
MVLWPAAAAVVLTGVGAGVSRSLDDGRGQDGLMASVGVVTFIVYATLIPTMFRMARVSAAVRLALGLRVMGIRFVATVAVAVMLVVRRVFDAEPFLIGIASAYVVLTMIESVILVRWNNQLENQA